MAKTLQLHLSPPHRIVSVLLDDSSPSTCASPPSHPTQNKSGPAFIEDNESRSDFQGPYLLKQCSLIVLSQNVFFFRCRVRQDFHKTSDVCRRPTFENLPISDILRTVSLHFSIFGQYIFSQKMLENTRKRANFPESKVIIGSSCVVWPTVQNKILLLLIVEKQENQQIFKHEEAYKTLHISFCKFSSTVVWEFALIWTPQFCKMINKNGQNTKFHSY